MNENQPRPTGWTTSPPTDDSQREWTITRAPTKGSFTAVIVSHQLIGREMHYYAGRSRPHTSPTCEACDNGRRKEWKGYLACRQLPTGRRYIVEVTARVARQIADHFAKHRTLKGSVLVLSRVKPEPQARIVCDLRPPQIENGEYGREPDLRPILEKMWAIDTRTELAAELTEPIKIADTPA